MRLAGIPRLAVFVAVLAWSAPLLAQGTPRDHLAVFAGVSQQTSATTFAQTVTFEAFAEDGSLDTAYSIAQHPRVAAGAVVRVWRGFGVGVAATAMRGTDAAQISGQIPHPINPNQPRALNGAADAFHRESAIHVQAAYWTQPSPRIDVLVGAGPSFMHMEQDFASDVSYTQVFPYDTVTFQGATLTREQKHAIGFHASAQVGIRLIGRLGAAGLVRYSRATLTFSDTAASSVKLGGLEVGGGLHLTF
jgi:hypothetical protein